MNGISALSINDRPEFHIYPTIIQKNYLQRFPPRLCAAETWRGRGAESRGEGTDDHEGWQTCHYDATARGGKRGEIMEKE